jgi:hypothetical protein
VRSAPARLGSFYAIGQRELVRGLDTALPDQSLIEVDDRTGHQENSSWSEQTRLWMARHA